MIYRFNLNGKCTLTHTHIDDFDYLTINMCYLILGRLSKNMEDLYTVSDRKGKEFLLSPVNIFVINYVLVVFFNIYLYRLMKRSLPIYLVQILRRTNSYL